MIFLKLGGSLITDKSKPETPRLEIINQCAAEIKEVWASNSEMDLILGHGSGSFGHYYAQKYQTRAGVSSKEQWIGFSQVWASANQLNRLVIDALRAVDLPAMSFSPSSYMICEQGQIVRAFLDPIKEALDAGLIPVVHGDVAFDDNQGATIISTENVLESLVNEFSFHQILLAGLEDGVLNSYPDGHVIPEINQLNLPNVEVTGSNAFDVTGGMIDKVRHALSLSERYPSVEIRIFSGDQVGGVRAALHGESVGTRVHFT